ncbi:MAG: succinate dehydrogenase iron-sulfur subunit [Chloroflexi bacterium]|nr:succinate dehydrogenase iron-sulfur subunit [Chloroflexota bacterium]
MSEKSTENKIFKVLRYNPESDGTPRFQEFVVPVSHGMTILDGLLYIKENLDSSLAFRASCRMAICGSCGMMVNNYPHLACHTQIEEFHSDRITLKPLPNLPHVKDLVADLTPMFSKHKSVKPYLIRSDKDEMEKPTAEYLQLPRQLGEYLQFSYCIKCGICVSACPTSASDKLFLGPQALAQCYHYCADSRDAGERERFPIVDADHGAWNCHLAGACSEACPKGVDPALAIQLLKKRMSARALGFGDKHKPATLLPPPTTTKPKVPAPEFNVKSNK